MATHGASARDLEPLPGRAARSVAWIKLLRLHHWLKNVLLGVPLVTAQAWAQPTALGHLLLGFLAFSLVASATYVLNDLADVDFDRKHVAKQHRPLAARQISELSAIVVAGLIAAAGIACGWAVGLEFLSVLAAYVALTTLYTRGLKRVALVDVVALSALWTLRLVAGAAAIHVEISAWLLSFGAFLFLSVALVKRCAELRSLVPGADGLLPGRGYRREDLAILQGFGLATAAVSVLVLALFVDSTSAVHHYPHPARLWLICPAIWFWLGRIWLVTGRGEMPHDPIVWSLRDAASWGAFAAVAAAFAAALLGP